MEDNILHGSGGAIRSSTRTTEAPASLGHMVGTGTCGPAQGPPDPVVGSALWRPGHRVMKKKIEKKLGASSAPALAREGEGSAPTPNWL
eukprot:scaffold6203_cov147-Isochrysis_galbana.AAC.3